MNGPIDVAPGIARIAIRTPWPVGPVNVYVLDDDPLTLVDTGQRTPEALADLEAGLRELGHRVEDLERIVVTHQHIDHCGLAATLVARSGAELCALGPMADWLSAYPGSAEAEDDFEHAILERHGARAPALRRGANRGALLYGEPAVVTRRLADGEVLESARRRLRVLHRPGHSPLDTVFHDEERGLLVGGDHLLAWPSTPIMAPPLGQEARNGRPRAFHDYLGSLRATDALSLEAVLPGHGDVVADPRATIGKRFDRYARITARTAEAVHPDPRSAATIATELKGPLPEKAAFFMLCEVLGHLDELIDAGAVVEDAAPGGVARFAAA
jgi:glyoxylase-like metal-dependent hydrolase (beta-lactamase superfamily II)